MVNFTPRPLYPTPSGWAPELDWMFWRRVKSPSRTTSRSPDRPACNLVAIPTERLRLQTMNLHVARNNPHHMYQTVASPDKTVQNTRKISLGPAVTAPTEPTRTVLQSRDAATRSRRAELHLHPVCEAPVAGHCRTELLHRTASKSSQRWNLWHSVTARHTDPVSTSGVLFNLLGNA
jgi:hypothetical protein